MIRRKAQDEQAISTAIIDIIAEDEHIYGEHPSRFFFEATAKEKLEQSKRFTEEIVYIQDKNEFKEEVRKELAAIVKTMFHR